MPRTTETKSTKSSATPPPASEGGNGAAPPPSSTGPNSEALRDQPQPGAEPIATSNGEDKRASPSSEAVAAGTTAKAKPPIKLTAAKLRMDPANETMGTARKLLTRVPVLPKPEPQWWVQTHPDQTFRLNSIGILEYNRDRRLYAVDPSLSEILKAHYRKHYIFTACSKGKGVFLWVIKMPGEDGSWNGYPASLHGCALACADEWLQVTTGPGYYETTPAVDYHPPPKWEEVLYPCTTMDELLAIAFRQTYLDSENHPVVLELLGKNPA